MSERTGYRNPAPTVDVIIEIGDAIVLVERKHEPVGWALPGGFVDYGEAVADAAVREAREETLLDVELVELFHVYSDPSRDPRQHTVSTVFIGRADGEPRGGDDAAVARLFRRDELPESIVFDHPQILKDYFTYRDRGERPPPKRERESPPMSYAHELTDAEKRELLRIARATLREFLRSGRMPPGKPHRDSLVQNAGAFVTLHRGEELRGCIGRQEETTPLYKTIQEMAIAAASKDPRFPPVLPDELDELTIEVSVLGDRASVTGPGDFEVGAHGLFVVGRGRRGLLLPQVATEHGWDAEAFLDHTCAKAKLPADAWRGDDTTIERFTAQVFSDTTHPPG